MSVPRPAEARQGRARAPQGKKKRRAVPLDPGRGARVRWCSPAQHATRGYISPGSRRLPRGGRGAYAAGGAGWRSRGAARPEARGCAPAAARLGAQA